MSPEERGLYLIRQPYDGTDAERCAIAAQVVEAERWQTVGSRRALACSVCDERVSGEIAEGVTVRARVVCPACEADWDAARSALAHVVARDHMEGRSWPEGIVRRALSIIESDERRTTRDDLVALVAQGMGVRS